MIAEVIPEVKTAGEMESFSYLIPEKLEGTICVGSIVKIPFGKRKIRGVVAQVGGRGSVASGHYKLKEILSVDPDFKLPEKYLEIAKWVSEYYLCSLGEAIAMFLPPEMVRPRASAQVESKKLKVESETVKLSDAQKVIFENLRAKQKAVSPKPALIFGVTGSGKTEIYIKLALEVLKAGKQVVVLVPEIILTPQTVERFREIFGDLVCLMHSHLSKSEKYQCYADFYTGRKPIIVGPRSALLVPSDKIGLIIIDEEQEDSFKQEQNPRYHAVTLAEKIAAQTEALLLLGTATPRIETYFKAKTGKYELFILAKRFQKDMLPPAEIVDLRDEIKKDNISPISTKLNEEIAEVLARKKQVLLFLNRRGTATFVSCRDCGHVLLCQNCSIPLVYHLNGEKDYLGCHHCDYKQILPRVCPECGSMRIKFFGAGVNKIEAEIKKQFPLARLARVDSTTIRNKGDYEKFYKEFKNGEIDIIIGTQMIAKGLDIPGVDLVGIVSADTGLHLPHYRAHERIFQLLTQVSGRSGRREHIGRTVIQTYWPEAQAVVAASRHNYEQFYDREITEREKFGYPPFIKLINVVAEHEKEETAKKLISKVAAELSEREIKFIGPGGCFYERLHGKFRRHLIIKTDQWPLPEFREIIHNNPHVTFDVEPTNLL